jgi:hypothetical protein
MNYQDILKSDLAETCGLSQGFYLYLILRLAAELFSEDVFSCVEASTAERCVCTEARRREEARR